MFKVALAIFKLNEQKILEVDDPLEVFQVVQVSISTYGCVHFCGLPTEQGVSSPYISEYAKEDVGLPSTHGGKQFEDNRRSRKRALPAQSDLLTFLLPLDYFQKTGFANRYLGR